MLEQPNMHKRHISYEDVKLMTKEEFKSLPKKDRKKLEGTVPLTQEEIDVSYHYAALACSNYHNVFQIYNIDRETVIQDTMLKVFRFRYAYRGESEWSTYVYRIACNTLLNCISAAKRKGDVRASKKEYMETWDEGDDSNSFYMEVAENSSTDSLEDAILQEERMEKFYEMLECLEEGMREVVLMLMDGKSYKEISENMDLPLGSCQSRIHRAKVILSEIRPYFDV